MQYIDVPNPVLVGPVVLVTVALVLVTMALVDDGTIAGVQAVVLSTGSSPSCIVASR